MGLTRADLYPTDHVRLADALKALGHPARLSIVRILLDADACITGSLVDELGLAQATVSQHLKVLKEAGLIQGTIDGRTVCYCIDPAGWTALRDAIGPLLHHGPAADICCPDTSTSNQS